MLETANASLIGNRKINQDRCAVLGDKRCSLLLLSDGLGGHPKGEVAAQIFIDTGKIAFSSSIKPIPNPQEFLDRIIRTAHESILAFGNKHTPPINPRATAVLALIQNGQLFWRHIGDSRLYLFRNTKVVMRTRDHSVLEAMQIDVDNPNDPNMLRYQNLITRCLGGTKRVLIDTSYNDPIALNAMDTLLLCTDGLWGQFNERMLSLKIHHQIPLERLVTELANEAFQTAKPRSDNITLIIARWMNPPVESTSMLLDTEINAETTIPSSDSGLREAISTLRSALDIFSYRKKS